MRIFGDLRILGQAGPTIGVGLLFDTAIARLCKLASIAAMLGRWLWWPTSVRTRPVSPFRRPSGPAQRLAAAKSLLTAPPLDWSSALPWSVTSGRIRGHRAGGLGVSSAVLADWVPDSDTPAFLQYPSGSTSDPESVVITLGRLVHRRDVDRGLRDRSLR